MSRRRVRRVDPYPGPDAFWLFLQRNRRPLAILAGAVLVAGLIWVVTTYWRGGGCAGSEVDRAVVAELLDDPLLISVPAEATATAESTSYLSCRNERPDVGTTRRVPSATLPIAIELVKEYRLARPMTVRELYDQNAAAVGRGGWRLSHADGLSLSYCRAVQPYRVVSLMTLADRRLTVRTVAWTDGGDCGAEVAAPR